MSFFNLTHTGVQDPFKTASHTKKDGKLNESSKIDTQIKDETANESSSLSSDPQAVTQAEVCPSHIDTMYSSSETGVTGRSWHKGSHLQYTELLRKHQRQPQGPIDLYQHPLTTSSEYGWWMKERSPHKESWAQCERHVHVNSEMTRFVDDMSLTNKEFSLY